MKTIRLPAALSFVYALYVLLLFRLNSLSVPCLRNPYSAYEFADCSMVAAMDSFLVAACIGLLAVVVAGVFFLKKGRLAKPTFGVVLLLCTVTAIAGYYGYSRYVVNDLFRASLYVDSVLQ